jgi:hypothetical protein
MVGTFIIGNATTSVKPAAVLAFVIITFFLSDLRVNIPSRQARSE